MKKTAALIAALITPLFLLLLLTTAALVTQSCGNGESVGNSTSSSSGGSTGPGSGGSSNSSSGSGGALITFGSGGANVNQGSGGASTSSSGGSSPTGTGGSTTSSGTGGSSVIVGNGSGGSTIVTGGGGGGPVAGGTDSAFAMDGYGMNATWMGYVFPSAFGTTATITPTMTFVGKQVCAMGTVGADPTYMSGAEIGWNIAQAKATTAASPPVLAAAPGGTGLSLTLSGIVTGFRAQIQDAAGTKRWCAQITSNMMQIPWASFNTMCWDPTNALAAAYSPSTPIASIAVVIPASLTPTPFNFCVIDAKPY